MMERQLTRYAIKLNDEVKSSFESVELDKYKDMIEDMSDTFSVETACDFLHLIMSKLEMRMVSSATGDNTDVDNRSHSDSKATWLWKQVEKLVDRAPFSSITKGLSTPEITGMCHLYF